MVEAGAHGAGGDLSEENVRLKKELTELHNQREREIAAYEAKIASERSLGQSYTETIQHRSRELDALKSRMVKLTRQLDDEVVRRGQLQAESSRLERRLQDLEDGGASARSVKPEAPGPGRGKAAKEVDEMAERERGSQVSTKLMRVMDQWMRQSDLQQALLRGAAINDQAFSTLVQALNDCPSLQTLDLSSNLLTMDSCSDICQLITTAPNLSFISLAENLLSLRSIGYFMTAIMERQHTKKLMPLDLLDLQGNEGLVAAVVAPAPEALMLQVTSALGGNAQELPLKGTELIVQVMRALWRFLHETGHPQVRDTSADEVAFQAMDKATVRSMDNALLKILLLGADGQDPAAPVGRAVTANLALAPALGAPAPLAGVPGHAQAAQGGHGHGHSQKAQDAQGAQGQGAGDPRRPAAGWSDGKAARYDQQESVVQQMQQNQDRPKALLDPFADLKSAFEPPREKLRTFNLKQVVTRNGTVLMNMLERLLETTEVDARDVETDQTLLEYACHTGNMGLAKLCYRRGANLAGKTKKGDTAFNIVTKSRRYDLMEFLHTYGVKVNSGDAMGRTALHIAAANDDIDGVCRLVEWGADVNIRDLKRRTPIHSAAAGGNMKSTMLLLEIGADMNAKDEREYTAVAHAEANNHFALMDRLVQLGGRGHGLHQKTADLARSKTAKIVGEIIVSAGMLKSSSLGRIGKVAVKGMTGPLSPSSLK